MARRYPTEERKFQILRMVPGDDRYSFVAHGARYEKSEAFKMQCDMEARGCKVKLIPAPTERERNRSINKGYW